MKLEIYEPSINHSQASRKTMDNDLEMLKGKFKSLDIKRYTPESDEVAFTNNLTVNSIMQESGQQVLPVVYLNGKIIKEGEYPSLEEMEKAIKGE